MRLFSKSAGGFGFGLDDHNPLLRQRLLDEPLCDWADPLRRSLDAPLHHAGGNAR